jgi:hypothetical protein
MKDARRDLDAGHRVRILADAYGVDRPERVKLLEIADGRFARVWHTIGYPAEHLGGGLQRMRNAGTGDRIRREHAWLGAEQRHLQIALR